MCGAASERELSLEKYELCFVYHVLEDIPISTGHSDTKLDVYLSFGQSYCEFYHSKTCIIKGGHSTSNHPKKVQN